MTSATFFSTASRAPRFVAFVTMSRAAWTLRPCSRASSPM